jgi:hypothetical protein
MSNGSEEYKIHRKNEMLIKRKRIKIYTSVSQQTIGIPDGTTVLLFPSICFLLLVLRLTSCWGFSSKNEEKPVRSITFHVPLYR